MNFRTVIAIAVAASVALAGWLAYGSLNARAAVETVVAEVGPIREFVEERGQTRLPDTVLISMPYEGRIAPIDLTEGTPVKKGQVVARIVPEDLATRVAEATAAVERLEAQRVENRDTSVERTAGDQAQRYVESMTQTVKAAEARVEASLAKREFADKNLQRVRSLFERKASSEELLNRAELEMVQGNVEYRQDQLILTALRSIHAATVLLPTIVEQYIDRKGLHGNVLEKEQAEAVARRTQVLRNQQRGTMTSPVDGVVLRRNISNERVVATGTVLLEIGRLDQLQVEADVLTQDAVRIKPGNPVDIFGPAIGTQHVQGTVTRINPAGFTKVSSLGVEQQRVLVILDFSPADLPRLIAERQLGVGFRVSVRIYTAEDPKALVIPRSAVFQAPAGGWQSLVVEDGVVRLRNLKLGLMNDSQVAVLSGLSSGAEVVLAPESKLTDGARVRSIRRAE